MAYRISSLASKCKGDYFDKLFSKVVSKKTFLQALMTHTGYILPNKSLAQILLLHPGLNVYETFYLL